MPLVKSGSKQAVSRNIKAELAAGKPQKQAVAIALAVKRKAEGVPVRRGGVLERMTSGTKGR